MSLGFTPRLREEIVDFLLFLTDAGKRAPTGPIEAVEQDEGDNDGEKRENVGGCGDSTPGNDGCVSDRLGQPDKA